MTHVRRGAICVWFLGSIFALDLAGQNPAAKNLQSDPDPVAPAVVQLLAVGPGDKGQNHECSATGFLVNEDGYILTNAHVVEKSEECLAKSPGAKILAKLASASGGRPHATKLNAAPSGDSLAQAVSCDVMGVDDVHDLAMLKTERPFTAGTRAGAMSYVVLSAADLTSGTPVKVSGHPAFAWVALTQSGHSIGQKSLSLFEKSTEQTDMIVLDIPLQRGNSGSPVYLEAGGAVVGVVERQDTSNSFHTLAVPARYAIELMDRLGVKYHALEK